VLVETVETGAQAIAAVRGGEFDVVLMDGSMPDIDGFQATREIRLLEARMDCPRLPIIALTAHVIGTAAKAWQDAGMDGVIYKPYTVPQLADCFRKLFPDRSQQTPSARPDQDRSNTVTTPSSPDVDRIATRGEELFDRSVLQGFTEMGSSADPNFLIRIFSLYIENAPRALDEITDAVRDGDVETCGRVAHSLKSMSYSIGAKEVAACSVAIERCARNDNCVPDVEEMGRLAKVLATSLEFIEATRRRAMFMQAVAAPHTQLSKAATRGSVSV
jgi:CheY-like chemotaxis protein